MKCSHRSTFKRFLSCLLSVCMLFSMLQVTAFAATTVRDGEVVKQGTLVASDDGMVTVLETAEHTSGNNFNVTMTVTTSDLVEITPTKAAHIVLCIDRSNSMDGERRTNTEAAVDEFIAGVLDEDGIKAGNQIAVVGFGTKYWNYCGLTSNVQEVKKAAASATAAVSDVNDGGTNAQAGIYAAHQILAADMSSAQKVILFLSDGMPTYSYRLVGTADYTGCSGSGRRHNWNSASGTFSNIAADFDHDVIVGSGSAFEYTKDSHYAALTVTCEHDRTTTLTHKTYTDNGQPAIVQAKAAKDAGIEIYTVFLDGYTANEQNSKKNAEDTMKAVATDEDHYMVTKDMSELSSLFRSIGSSLVTETKAGLVTAPMGDYINLGDVYGLSRAGITETDDGLTWNVTAVTPTVNAESGTRSYTVTYPISLDTAKTGFVEDQPYAVNPSAILTYSVGGEEKQVAFDIPTVKGFLPRTTYSICYFLQGDAESGDYANYTLTDTDSDLSGIPGTMVGLPIGHADKYADHTFAYSSTGSAMTLTEDGANIMCLYYDKTYIPPAIVEYSVKHEYYTNGEYDGCTSTTLSAPEGSEVSANGITKVENFNNEAYTYTSCTPSVLTVSAGSSITLRYDRTVEIPPVVANYTIRHEYYTNGQLDGVETFLAEGVDGQELTANDIEKVPTYLDETYEYMECSPDCLILQADADNVMTLRYSRTIFIPVDVPYTIVYTYYTNGVEDGKLPVGCSGEESTVLVGADLPQIPTFSDGEYTFTSSLPETITLQPDGNNTIVLRYDRTVEVPPADVPCKIFHEYYTNGQLDGSMSSELIAKEGDEVSCEEITKQLTFNGEAYNFTSCMPGSLIVIAGSDNTFTFRYDRTVRADVSYTIKHEYYTNGVLDETLPVELSGKEGDEIPSGSLPKLPTYQDMEYTYSSCTPDTLTLQPGAENVMILRYDRTVVIPADVSYTVIHSYYTNGNKDGDIPELLSGKEGTTITGSALTRHPTYLDVEYTYSSCSPSTLSLRSDGDNTITLRYDRTVEVPPADVPFTAVLTYSVNDEPIGKVVIPMIGKEGDVIVGSELERKPVYNDETYEYDRSEPEQMTLGEEPTPSIDVFYSRSVELPSEAKYTVVHQYYHNDYFEGQITEEFTGAVNETVDTKTISRYTTYKNNVYTFTSSTPDSLVLTEGENKLVFRYDRSTKRPDAPKPSTPTQSRKAPPENTEPATGPSSLDSALTADRSTIWLYMFICSAAGLFCMYAMPWLYRKLRPSTGKRILK